MFVYGDVVYAQTWQVLTLKNCMEPFSYASAAYVVASALVSVRLFCKNLGNLQKFFGQMVYRPPLAKNSPYAYERSKTPKTTFRYDTYDLSQWDFKHILVRPRIHSFS